MRRFQQIRQALGSEAVLTLILPENREADSIFDLLWSQINRFETSFSRFFPESELSRFNLQAGKTVAITPEFKKILEICKEMSQKTNGIFNPFVLPSLQRAGYIGSWPKPDKTESSVDYRQKGSSVDINQLIIGQNSAKIPKNSALDLGGIGKGYLLDQLSEFAEKQNIDRYWFSLGGDIICSGRDIDDKPWSISISDAVSPEKTIEKISNNGQKIAIATSGIIKRQGRYMGKKWHHLIDPRTGKPALTNVLTATVCAETAVVADVAAKCLVIGGSDRLKNIVNKLPISKAFLQLRPNSESSTIKEDSHARLIKY